MTARDLTPGEHAHSAQVEQAAEWLSKQPPGSVRPIIPALRERFPVTVAEACEIRVLSKLHRARRAAAQ